MAANAWRGLSRAQYAVMALAGVGFGMPERQEDIQNLPQSLYHMLVPAALGESASASADPVDRFKSWLRAHGADISHVDFKPSKVATYDPSNANTNESGIGLYVAEGQRPIQSRRRWFGLRPAPYVAVADFPLSLAITADNILSETQVGQKYRWLLERGALDERDIIQFHLAVERARGEQSPLHPWMAMLPTEFHSPLCWSAEELAQLKGTTLDQATQALQKRLRNKWQQDVEAPLAEVAKQLGAPRSPTLDDFIWSHCVFWSRGQSLPVPSVPGEASRLVATHRERAAQTLTVHEGIVPGLDFANHQGRAANCWWEVVQSSAASSTAATASHSSSSQLRPLATAHVKLQLHRGQRVTTGDELTINYGEGKSNEELLLLYGFVEPQGTQADVVMLPVPTPPPQDWDAVMEARMQLLMHMGTPRQFFLHPAPVNKSGGPALSAAIVPQDVLEVLEVFSLKPEEVQARLDAIYAHDKARRQGDSRAVLPTPHPSGVRLNLAAISQRLKRLDKVSDSELRQWSENLGLRMSALSTYVRLLEVRLIDLEDPKRGTGSLEDDEKLLIHHASAMQRQQLVRQGKLVPLPPGTATGELPYRHWCAVVYRMGQKRVTRWHLLGARQELQEVLKVLTEVQDGISKRDRAAVAGSR